MRTQTSWPSLYALVDELQESLCVLIVADCGEFRSCAMFHGLCRCRSPFFHTIFCQNVYHCQKVNFSSWTLCWKLKKKNKQNFINKCKERKKSAILHTLCTNDTRQCYT